LPFLRQGEPIPAAAPSSRDAQDHRTPLGMTLAVFARNIACVPRRSDCGSSWHVAPRWPENRDNQAKQRQSSTVWPRIVGDRIADDPGDPAVQGPPGVRRHRSMHQANIRTRAEPPDPGGADSEAIVQAVSVRPLPELDLNGDHAQGQPRRRRGTSHGKSGRFMVQLAFGEIEGEPITVLCTRHHPRRLPNGREEE